MLLAVTLIVASCSKKNNEPNEESKHIHVKITDSIKIGNLFWSTTNFNGDGGINYGENPSTNEVKPNDPKKGKLYSLKDIDMMILPRGWRIPTANDFQELCKSAGAYGTLPPNIPYYILEGQNAAKLMSPTGGWAPISNLGTVNNLGFNAVSTGYYVGSFFPNYAMFWSTSNYSGVNEPALFAIFDDNNKYRATMNYFLNSDKATYRMSIRFVRDN